MLLKRKDITKSPTVPQCAGGGREGRRGERSFPRPPKAAKRLEVERFEEKAEKLFRKISRPKHRRTEGGSVRRRRVSEASLEPERLAKPISPAEHRRTEGGSVRSKEAAKRLKVECFGEKSTVCSFRKKSRPEHRSIPKG